MHCRRGILLALAFFFLAAITFPADAQAIRVEKKWLENEWGRETVRFRPGELITGIFRLETGEDLLLEPVFSIEAFDFTYKRIPEVYAAGQWVWDHTFRIPSNRAMDKQRGRFELDMNVNGSPVRARKYFRIARDGIVNAGRAHMAPMNARVKADIKRACRSVRRMLKRSDLKFDAGYQTRSRKASQFMRTLEKKRPNAFLIHSHGSAEDGGRIYMQDESYIDAATFAGLDFNITSGLFYAAICNGAESETLGRALVDLGFDAFIGYEQTVYTVRNLAFYEYFFEMATQSGISVSEALAAAIAWAQSRGWSDVASAVIIGDGEAVFLGGLNGDEAAIAARATEPMPVRPPAMPWRDVRTLDLTDAQREAVRTADDWQTGIEVYPEVLRVAYKQGGRFVYGVDVHVTGGNILFQGYLD